MTAADRRVALVAVADGQRSALAVYLAGVGFDVHECEELTVAGSFAAVVHIADAAADGLAARVRSWLRSTRPLRIVVVTAQPVALRRLAATYPDRLTVLPAPAFGWDVIDALRAFWSAGPRGA